MMFVVLLLIPSLVAVPSYSIISAKPFREIAKQADAARAADHIGDAIRLYEQGLRMRPAWLEGWWSLGTLFYDQDRFPEAEAAFRHFVALTPKPAPAYAFLGLCEYETRDYDRALQHFRAWARNGWAGTPQLIDVSVFHFSLLLTRNGEFVESLYLLATEAAKVGDTPALSEAMGMASLRMRNVPEDYPPASREMVWLAGESALYGALHDFPRADEYANRLLSNYGQQPEVHYFRATLFIFENNTAEAKREFQEELRISPQHVLAALGLADIDLQDNQLAEASALAKRSIEIEPSNAEAHHMLGRVLIATGNLRESMRELELAKRLAPDSPPIRSHLAIAYGRLGRSQQAKAEAAAYLLLKNRGEILAPFRKKALPDARTGQSR